jgi:hypothetical protein
VAIWYILWPFGIFYGYLVYFSRFGMLYPEKYVTPAVLPSDGLKTETILLHFKRL